MSEVHVVVPEGIDDRRRPSGGNVYDRRVCRGLADLGWSVHEQAVADLSDAAAALARVPDGGSVLIDGLVASEVLEPEARRLRLVVLLHMPRDDPREAAALSAASAIVATSGWTRRWLIEHSGLTAGRVHVVPPGVDPADLTLGTASGGQLLSVGAVTPVKGQDLLVDALGQVDDLLWRCGFVGALDVDSRFAADVRLRVADLGLADRVHFTGPLRRAELDAAYAEADVLVLSSRAESYGMVITEALARGLPVIASDVGGVPEALGRAADGSVPGLLVPPDDAPALGQALRRWMDDPRERERLRAAARSRRQTLVDWQRTSRALSAVLVEVSGR